MGLILKRDAIIIRFLLLQYVVRYLQWWNRNNLFLNIISGPLCTFFVYYNVTDTLSSGYRMDSRLALALARRLVQEEISRLETQLTVIQDELNLLQNEDGIESLFLQEKLHRRCVGIQEALGVFLQEAVDLANDFVIIIQKVGLKFKS